ncbi:MAG: hypothetical protein NTZ48_04180 [Candidatus Omnitrophica bacterium]|nr:hypothetical protein [Candidatus Omnitrophota bacterium]
MAETRLHQMPPETLKQKQAFEVWFRNNRDPVRTAEEIGTSHQAITKWAKAYRWDARALKREMGIDSNIERLNINEKVQRYKDQRDLAELLRQAGIKYIVENGISSAKDALLAIKTAADLDKPLDDIPGWVIDILNAPEANLVKLQRELESRRRNAIGDGEAEDQGNATQAQSIPFTESG